MSAALTASDRARRGPIVDNLSVSVNPSRQQRTRATVFGIRNAGVLQAATTGVRAGSLGKALSMVGMAKAMGRGGAGAARSDRLVHLVADPGLPADIAEELHTELSDALSWPVKVTCQPLDVDEHAGPRLAPGLTRELPHRDGDIVVVLTDQPRRAGTQIVLADVDRGPRVALISLPGLGALGLVKRVRAMVVLLADELMSQRSPLGGEQSVATLPGVHRVEGDQDDVRFYAVGAIARLRLLTGMVKANRPWRLVPQLSGAFAGALATGAYVVVNSSIWRLADTAGPMRLSLATLFAITAMVTWLLVKHRLWERPTDRTERRMARLYNVTTVITLTIGVVLLYLGLFTLCLVGEVMLLRDSILGEALRHPVRWTDYATVAWLASSMATVGGAIGSGLDSDDAARRAAFGSSQRERNADQREELGDEGNRGDRLR